MRMFTDALARIDRRRPMAVIRIPRRCRAMAWAAHEVIGNRRPQAIHDLVYNPGSYAEAESGRSVVARELDCRVTMLQVIHVQRHHRGCRC